LRYFPDWLARAVSLAILSLARLWEASILFFSGVKMSTSPQILQNPHQTENFPHRTAKEWL